MALPTPVPGAGRKRRFGATGTFREYIWLPEVEIAPTMGSATAIDRLLASVTLANTIVYQPLSNLVQSLSYGNGLNDWHTFTADYELDVLGVYDGATTVINRAHTRADNLNLTNVSVLVGASDSPCGEPAGSAGGAPRMCATASAR